MPEWLFFDSTAVGQADATPPNKSLSMSGTPVNSVRKACWKVPKLMPSVLAGEEVMRRGQSEAETDMAEQKAVHRKAGDSVTDGLFKSGRMAAVSYFLLTHTAMTEAIHSETSAASRPPLPDRLSIDARSPYHVRAVFEHDIGIRFNGKDRNDVEEYCISEGWVRVPAGKTLDRKGQPLLIKLKGKVEAFYR